MSERAKLAAAEDQALREIGYLGGHLASMRWSLLTEIAILRTEPSFEDQRALADLLTTAADALGDAVDAANAAQERVE